MLRRYEQFSSHISSLYRQIQKLERDEMVKYGLKGAYAQYLTTIHHYPEGVTAAKLCELCDMDKAAVSRAVSEMEERGLVTRPSGDGGYRAPIRLTADGEAAASFVQERAVVAVELAGNGLTDEDRAVFYKALALIEKNLRQVCRQGIPEGK